MSHVFHPGGAAAEARRAYEEVERLNTVLDEGRQKAILTSTDASRALGILYQYAAMLDHLGLGEQAEEVKAVLRAIIVLATQARVALHLLQAAALGTMGPWGIGLGVAAMVGSALAFGSAQAHMRV